MPAPMSDNKLIYDVGANDGSDTAYYLKLGYHVLAIEANPLLAGRLHSRFGAEKAAGQLIVLNAAVTEKDIEKVEFYLSNDDSKSSLTREMAERDGITQGSVDVPGRSLGSLFEEFGVPEYCKIDIEGYDAQAIRGLAGHKGRPEYISCESSGNSIGEVNLDGELLYRVLDALSAAGYRRFKLVDQDSLLVLSKVNHYASLHKWSSRIWTKLERLSGRYTIRHNNKLYQLKKGLLEGDFSSGPFGESLAGEWNDYDTTKEYLTYHFKDYFYHTQNKRLIFWVDLHAKY